MSKFAWVTLAALSTITWAERAEACSCAPRIEIVHPSTSSIAAWDGLVGRTVFVGPPTVSVTYVDDPAQEPIAGTLTNLTGSDVVALWTFVPSAPLSAGRTIRAVVSGANGFASPRSYDYRVTTASVGAGPSFPGVRTMTAIVSRFHGSAGGSCAPSATQQSRVGFPGLPPPSAEAPIYRYFFYRPGEPLPTSGSYGIAGHYISTIRCGNPGLLCEPTFGSLVVGETICARVEALDLLGRTSGYASEACATVGEEEVDLATPFSSAVVTCEPHVEDGGVPGPDTGPAPTDGDASAPPADAGVRADAAVSADATTGEARSSDGCACVRAPDRGVLGSAGALLVGLVFVFGRRRV